ncbi:MAG: hypothetical protein FWF92_05475 [Oscillospiraceae bacterium]|nr:hypothetical protein [Oscillospiraceae bacterium]
MLNTVKLSGSNANISQLIIGGNIFSGTSHLSPEADNEMEDYYTAENIKKALFRSEECGINTMALRGDKHIFRIIREYRNEGGKLQWIAQTAPEMIYFKGNIDQIMKLKPVAIYLHGTVTDALFKEKKYNELKDRLKIIRDTGVSVGLCTHMPQVVEYSEEHNFDVDYYMTCLYNLSRIDRVSSAVTGKMENGEPFYREDRELMYKTIKSVSKQCHAFKILGAGRLCQNPEQVKDAFEETFANIKDIDVVVVGMFQKYIDQIKINSDIVRKILN